MAEVFGVVAGGLTVLELTAKIIKQCKSLVETAHDAPRDLRHIMVEVSSLKGVLESFEFLSTAEYLKTAKILKDAGGLVDECRSTVEEISQELENLTLANNPQVHLGKRKRIKESFQWCMKEGKTQKLLDETVKIKTTLTLALIGDITTDVKEIKSNIKGIKSKVDETNNDVRRVENRLSDREQRDICDWIEHTNPTAIHERACRNHENDTCQWIHHMDQWNEWLKLQRRTIWVHGIPGAGKTVLASYLIKEAIAYCQDQQDNHQTMALYYYCSFIHGQSERRDEALPCLRWIVSQLCRRKKCIPSILIELHQNNSTPTYEDLMHALHNLLAHLKVLYVLIDGADESCPRKDLLELVHDLATKNEYAKVQLLITSRRYEDIDTVLRPLSEPTLPMSNPIVDQDIRTYVEASLRRIKHFEKWPQVLRQNIIQKLVDGAQGMFRWAVCQIDRLQRKSSHDAEKAIENLPKTIWDTYNIIFLELSEDDRNTAKKALEWIYGITDVGFDYGMRGNCLHAAVDMSVNPGTLTTVCNNCDEHTYLKTILGCLAEVTCTATTDEDIFYLDPFETFMYREDFICPHKFTLAHYTVAEYLVSDRLTGTGGACIATSEHQCVETILKVACQTAACADLLSLEERLYPRFQDFCMSIILRAPSYWNSFLHNHHFIWDQHCQLFERYRQSSSFTWTMGLLYGPSKDPIVVKLQYAFELWYNNRFSKLRDLLSTLPARSILATPIPLMVSRVYYDSIQLNARTILENIADLHDHHDTKVESIYILLGILKSLTDVTELLQQCLKMHLHDKFCEESRCIILDLLQTGARVVMPGLMHTSLQVAVHCHDFEGVELLLKHDADPNGVGWEDGYAPPGIDKIWSLSSPLHILRKAGTARCYRLDMLENPYSDSLSSRKALSSDEKDRRGEEETARIEEVLLKYGARDFVVPTTPEVRAREFDLQYLLN